MTVRTIILVSPQYPSRWARAGLSSESQTAHRQQKLGSIDPGQSVEYDHHNEQPWESQ
jgi:hypothetical protein